MTRQYLGLFGIVLAVFGLANDWGWLIWTAVGVLAASLLCRLSAWRSGVRKAEDADRPES